MQPQAQLPVAPLEKPASGWSATVSATLDLSRQLLAFNWLTAAYAHRDWLGPWADILEPRRDASLRLIRRASIVLLERYDLRQRYVRDLGHHGWLLMPHAQLLQVADVLGTAMLGGWVQRRLERTEVALQARVLGLERRQRALQYAQELRALPFASSTAWNAASNTAWNAASNAATNVATTATGWPVLIDGSAAVFRLGVSCLGALLTDESSGARERFTLRLAHGMVTPLVLSEAQRDEALALIHATPVVA